MDKSERLMLDGVAAVCPDCGDERVLVEVSPLEYCCTTCDAAFMLVDVSHVQELRARLVG
jgi:hypothetical protein